MRELTNKIQNDDVSDNRTAIKRSEHENWLKSCHSRGRQEYLMNSMKCMEDVQTTLIQTANSVRSGIIGVIQNVRINAVTLTLLLVVCCLETRLTHTHTYIHTCVC